LTRQEKLPEGAAQNGRFSKNVARAYRAGQHKESRGIIEKGPAVL
jgi:hypothetical protein